jgi:hypothetical protein
MKGVKNDADETRSAHNQRDWLVPAEQVRRVPGGGDRDGDRLGVVFLRCD